MSVKEKLMKSLVERRLLRDVFWKIGHFFTQIRMGLDTLLSFPARRYLASHTEVHKNKVVFMTFNNNYACNPKYICEEILRQKLPLDLVWVSTEKK